MTLNSTHNIVQATATGEEINEICVKLEDALVAMGISQAHAVIAMLSLVLIIQNPTLSPEELTEALKDVSQYICLRLEGTGTDENGEPEKAN